MNPTNWQDLIPGLVVLAMFLALLAFCIWSSIQTSNTFYEKMKFFEEKAIHARTLEELHNLGTQVNDYGSHYCYSGNYRAEFKRVRGFINGKIQGLNIRQVDSLTS